MDKLPQELVDHFIDYLHDDYEPLLACSMVCRTWVPATRHHLFERVVIRDLDDLQALSNSTFPFSVTRKLSISCLESGTSDILGSSCWSRFDQITELRVENFDAESPELDSMVPHFFTNFPNVEQLSLMYSQFRSLQTVMISIHSFPRLLNLRICFTYWKTDLRTGDFPYVSFPVRHLRTLGISLDEFWDYLLELHPSPSLDLQIISTPFLHLNIPFLTRVLEGCRASLRVIDFKELRRSIQNKKRYFTSEIYLAMGYVQSFDLTHFPSLRTVVLPRGGSFSTIDALSTITSKYIHHIVIPVSGGSWLEMNAKLQSPTHYPWNLVDDIMTTKPLNRARLCAAIFWSPMENDRSLDEPATNLARMLPKCAARGALQVDAVIVASSVGYRPYTWV